MKGSKKRRFKPGFIALFSIACILTLCLVCLSQERKLNVIRAEQAALAEELLTLDAEAQRIEYMIEYAGNQEYLLQYAREKLGYVRPDDVKFSIQ